MLVLSFKEQDWYSLILEMTFEGRTSMIENRVLGFIECEDDINDTLEVVEGIVFNTTVLNLKAINGDMTTHIIIDTKKAKDLGEILLSWAEGKL